MIPEIERLAKEAGLGLIDFIPGKCVGVAENDIEALEKFAALIAEECAKAVESQPFLRGDGRIAGVASSAQAIRAKFALSGGEAK